MRVSRLTLDGEFIEAFLYYDFLWLLTRDGEAWAFDMTAYLNDEVASNDPDAVMAFTRNDQMPRDNRGYVDSQFKKKVSREFGRDGLYVEKKIVHKYSRVFKAFDNDAKSVLDFRCYYGRGFIATESRVFSLQMLGRTDLNHMQLGGYGNGALQGSPMADFRCRQFRTNFGMITAAAGPDGAWYASGLLANNPKSEIKFKRFSEKSVATEVMAGQVANVISQNSLRFFETDIHPIQNEDHCLEDEQQKQEIDNIESENTTYTDKVNGSLQAIENEKKTVFTKTFLSKSKIFASDNKNILHTISITENNMLKDPERTEPYPCAPGPILSLTFSAGGKAIVELDDRVCMWNSYKKTWDDIFDGEVYSVRGYPGSRWYQNLVTLVGDDRVELSFIV
ncbi:MAG: hypothetical protein ACOVN0_08615 [Niveispirillum sp.]|uniref:hypothetical protein n=1 Tax=Niveispirillum sp. TaxID=1917217 RepID=UPI003BA47ED6